MQAHSHKKILESWPVGLPVPEEKTLQILGKVMDAYMERMQVCNFTAHRTPERFALYNMVDSIVPYVQGEMAFSADALVADIGTGGGFPGVPLAALIPHATFSLFDSVGKKLKVIDEVIREVGIDNVRTQHVRLEEFGRELGREIYDVVTSRAVAHWSTLLELALPMLKKGGVLYAYQGERIFEELDASRKIITLLGGDLLSTASYELPGAGTRYIIRIQKVKSTPGEYPREYAVMKKNHL